MVNIYLELTQLLHRCFLTQVFDLRRPDCKDGRRPPDHALQSLQ